MKPLTPVYDPVRRTGRRAPKPGVYSLAPKPGVSALGPTDQRDTAAGTAVTYPWRAGVTEWYEDFQGITPGALVATSADWVETQVSVNHWYATASGASSLSTTADTTIQHQTPLSYGSKYVELIDVRGGVGVTLRGYRVGIYYYSSSTAAWYRCMREGGNYRPTNFNLSKVPSDNTPVDMRVEAIEEGANVRFRMWIDGVLWDEYVDPTPPADSLYVSLYVDGRGNTAIGHLTSIEAGRLVG